jgi:hypothetical protein
METGFDKPETTGADLLRRIETCHAEITAARSSGEMASGIAASPATAARAPDGSPASATGRASGSGPVAVPVLGAVDLERWSLPLLTVTLAGLDAFNPCAFFVLLFLLSLLVHARSRTRMLVIGGVFVLFSGLVYFAFMAAWLNVFLWLGELQAITAGAGLLAIVIGAVNTKDYFYFRRGVSLSIPESAKPGLFRRMREVATSGSLGPMLIGTVLLAIVANSYELLCTAGFPMVYTRALTLHDLGTVGYYGYVALYNVIYVVPLALIVLAFTYTLGSRKLSEHEGRVLKLVSGYMMLGLGIVLLTAPDLLVNALASLAVLASALLAAALTVGLSRKASA